MSVTSWSPIDTMAVFGRQRPPARAMRGSAAAIVSGSSSIGVGSGHATVTSAPPAASRSPRPIASMCPTTSRITTPPSSSSASSSACSWSITNGWSLPGTGIGCHFDAPAVVARDPVATTTASGASRRAPRRLSRRPPPARRHRARTPRSASRRSRPALATRELLGQTDLAAELVVRSSSVTSCPAPRPRRFEPAGPRRPRRRASPPLPDAVSPHRVRLPTDGGIRHAVDRQALDQVPRSNPGCNRCSGGWCRRCRPRFHTPVGSAINARTSVTASASPRSRIPPASSGVRMRCTANTGVSRNAFLTVCAE